MKREHGVHQRHCYSLHGCKYGNDDCPVTTGIVEQDVICEWCFDEGFENLAQIKEINVIKEQLRKAIEDKSDNITVPVDFLFRLLNRS